ncbi:hypothetical protein Scep_003084 [Stephania cephalantha]|uniref:RRM domain-containing protein n=1 Tax=Stephania cephalantha TaxID=152367 RepID=A0AAP0KSG3_9MAGN
MRDARFTGTWVYQRALTVTARSPQSTGVGQYPHHPCPPHVTVGYLHVTLFAPTLEPAPWRLKVTTPRDQAQLHIVVEKGLVIGSHRRPDGDHLDLTVSVSIFLTVLLLKYYYTHRLVCDGRLFVCLSHLPGSSVRRVWSGLKDFKNHDFPNGAMENEAVKLGQGLRMRGSVCSLQRRRCWLRFLGKVLSVEIAGKPSTNSNNSNIPTTLMKDAPLNLSIGSGPGAEPIAPRLGVDYPFPPHLEYAYPPPDGNILTNIVNALIAVPRFYTQVLHLMNKMNIPAPFRMALPTPPLPVSIPAPPPPPPSPPIAPIANPSLDLSSDESELESSEEMPEHVLMGSLIQMLSYAIIYYEAQKKTCQKEAIVGPAIDKDVAHEAVGLKPATLVPKEIPVIKKKNPVLQIKITSKPTKKQHDGEESHEKEEEEPLKEGLEVKPFATPEEIERGKLPPEELLSLPMFKNYAAGNPSTVLYIKNLSKDVVADDFFFIFGSVFASVDAAKSCLNVKLMQEGRMRGQAFVTFPSIELAHRALNLVNGYVFKGKPMIIQFGRKPVSGNAN